MSENDSEVIMEAYRGAMAGTWNDTAGMLAAETAYSSLHPEIDDKQLVCGLVARIVGLAILADPASFWFSTIGPI